MTICKKPEKTIPRAVLLSIFITAVLYVLTALAAVSVLGWEKLSSSPSPLADVAAKALGRRAFFLLAFIALFSTANTVLILIMSNARVLYGMARDGVMFELFGRVHKTRGTPHMATLGIAFVAVFMALLLRKIDIVANLTNFAIFTTFIFINAAVIVLRFKEPNTPRPFKIPLSIYRVPIVPVLGILSSFTMALYVGRQAFAVGV